jgi:hypothetical protein
MEKPWHGWQADEEYFSLCYLIFYIPNFDRSFICACSKDKTIMSLGRKAIMVYQYCQEDSPT